MTIEERIAELAKRVEALEKKVDSLTATNGNDEPSGRFASIGGIERRGPQDSTGKTTEPIDFAKAGGKRVR